MVHVPDARQRQGLSIVALIYLIGYIAGRASGKEKLAHEILRTHATDPSRT